MDAGNSAAVHGTEASRGNTPDVNHGQRAGVPDVPANPGRCAGKKWRQHPRLTPDRQKVTLRHMKKDLGSLIVPERQRRIEARLLNPETGKSGHHGPRRRAGDLAGRLQGHASLGAAVPLSGGTLRAPESIQGASVSTRVPRTYSPNLKPESFKSSTGKGQGANPAFAASRGGERPEASLQQAVGSTQRTVFERRCGHGRLLICGDPGASPRWTPVDAVHGVGATATVTPASSSKHRRSQVTFCRRERERIPCLGDCHSSVRGNEEACPGRSERVPPTPAQRLSAEGERNKTRNSWEPPGNEGTDVCPGS